MPVRILETTIRDGGYEISHQFTEEDVALVVSTLDAAGVEYIEIGYGMGVGAHRFPPSTRPKQRAVITDAQQMTTARAAARRAKLGVLYGAGERFCPPDYLDEVARCGMDFVRLAFMPSDVTPENLRYIERAKALGLTVSINCMQTYILSPERIAELATLTRKAGADWWYVVDSAGGMQPADIVRYVQAVRAASDIEVGLHAHNNLGLAVANCLASIEVGATLVDCTLNGLGRATGNAPTEQLLLALQTLGHEPDVDVAPIARLSQLFRVFFESKGNDPMHFVSGASMLHSRNIPAVVTQARKRGLSLTDFLVKVGAEARKENVLDRFAFPTEVFDRAAARSKPNDSSAPADALVHAIATRLGAQDRSSGPGCCEDLVMRSARYHVPSVLHLVPRDVFPFDGALPWQSRDLVGATLSWSGPFDLATDRRPDYLLIDGALASEASLPPCGVRVFTCAWADVWTDAVRAAVTAVAATGPSAVWLPTADERIADRLALAGLAPVRERPEGERVIVVAHSRDAAAWIPALRRGDVVVLLDRGAHARDVADAIRRAEASALTPPVGAVLAARAQELIALSARVDPLLAVGAGWVDPLQAPGRDQAVVDVALAMIVEDGARPRAELATEVAQARARTLVDGTGTP